MKSIRTRTIITGLIICLILIVAACGSGNKAQPGASPSEPAATLSGKTPLPSESPSGSAATVEPHVSPTPSSVAATEPGVSPSETGTSQPGASPSQPAASTNQPTVSPTAAETPKATDNKSPSGSMQPSATPAVSPAATPATNGDKPSTISVFIAGDSTASPYDQEEFGPRMGWGQVFHEFFNDKVTIRNYARSGRSSMSYITEGHLMKIANEIKEGDYLLIQFGHNDEKADDLTRYTEPWTTYQQYLTQYVEVAREKGAIPVLLTPVNRNKFDGMGNLVPTHGDYPAAMIDLAEKLDVPLIDMTEKSKELFESLGPERTKKEIFLHLDKGEHPNYPDGVKDDTHFKDTGAREIAKLIAEGIRELQLPLADYLK